MDTMELIIDFFKDLERLGPGDNKQSKKALKNINLENKSPVKIIDIGCGTGAQSIFLAKETKTQIIAVDFLQPFLDELERRADILKLDIKTICSSMDNLPFSEKYFDIIWSEGAVYNIGFNNGINYWKKFIKDDGYLSLTEMSWLTDSRPNEIENYWKKEYDEIDTIENKLKQLENAGYKIINYFTLPDYCWENYYKPIKENERQFINKCGNTKDVIEFIEKGNIEMEMYKRFNKYYGYVFYIVQNKI
jgi:ubiquinone/menaquinone biosynthesis C-methylase UbiE